MVRAEAPVTPVEHLAWWFATGLGAGYAPVAPGTAGSLLGLLLGWLLAEAGGAYLLVAATVGVAAGGIWAGGRVACRIGRDDPGLVVVDEIAGQLVALWWVPLSGATVVASFLLFRLFDIIKPFPARQSESLPGGLGIMMDDLIAGLYANLVLQVLVYWLPGPMGVA